MYGCPEYYQHHQHHLHRCQDYWTHDNDEWLEGQRQMPRIKTPGVVGHDYYRDRMPLSREEVRVCVSVRDGAMARWRDGAMA